MKYGPTYLKSICSGYAKDKKTLQEIATYLDEPEKWTSFQAHVENLALHYEKNNLLSRLSSPKVSRQPHHSAFLTKNMEATTST